MRKRILFLSIVALITTVFWFASFFNSNKNNRKAANRQTLIEHKFDLASIVFEPNRGQSERDVSFLHRGKNYSVLLKNTESVFLFDMPEPTNANIASKPSKCSKNGPNEFAQSKKTELSLKLLNSNQNSTVYGDGHSWGQTDSLSIPLEWARLSLRVILRLTEVGMAAIISADGPDMGGILDGMHVGPVLLWMIMGILAGLIIALVEVWRWLKGKYWM